jgi:hypothetical protein
VNGLCLGVDENGILHEMTLSASEYFPIFQETGTPWNFSAPVETTSSDNFHRNMEEERLVRSTLRKLAPLGRIVMSLQVYEWYTSQLEMPVVTSIVSKSSLFFKV